MSMSVARLSPAGRPVSRRTREIRRILDARYSLSFFDERAMRAQQRLEAASDGELDAGLDAI